jgi:nitrite reductase (NADH) large subunit
MILDGRLAGAVLVGDVAEGPWYCELIRSGKIVSSFRNDLMFGRPSQPSEPARRLAA